MQYADAINIALKTTQKVVVLLSKSSNTSHFVIKELERAISNKIPIIPLRIEDFNLSNAMELFLSSTQWLDASTTPIEYHIPELIKSIKTELINIEGSAHKVMSEEDIRRIMTGRHTMIGTDSWEVAPTGVLGYGKPHPRFYGTYPRVLCKYVRVWLLPNHSLLPPFEC